MRNHLKKLVLEIGSLYVVAVEGDGAWRSVGATMAGEGYQVRMQSGTDSTPTSPRFTVYLKRADCYAPARLRRSKDIVEVYCDGVFLKSASVLGTKNNWQVEVSPTEKIDLMVCGIRSLPRTIMLESVTVSETTEGTIVIL